MQDNPPDSEALVTWPRHSGMQCLRCLYVHRASFKKGAQGAKLDLGALARTLDDHPQVRDKSAPLCKFAIPCVFSWDKARYKEACAISGFAVGQSHFWHDVFLSLAAVN